MFGGGGFGRNDRQPFSSTSSNNAARLFGNSAANATTGNFPTDANRFFGNSTAVSIESGQRTSAVASQSFLSAQVGGAAAADVAAGSVFGQSPVCAVTSSAVFGSDNSVNKPTVIASGGSVGVSSSGGVFGGTSAGTFGCGFGASSGTFGGGFGTGSGTSAGTSGGGFGATSGTFGGGFGTDSGTSAGILGGGFGASSGTFGSGFGTTSGTGSTFGNTSGTHGGIAGASSSISAGKTPSNNSVNVFAQSATSSTCSSSNPSLFATAVTSSVDIQTKTNFGQQQQPTVFGQNLSPAQLFGKAPVASTFISSGSSVFHPKFNVNGQSSSVPLSSVAEAPSLFSSARATATCNTVSSTSACLRDSTQQESRHTSLFTTAARLPELSSSSVFAGSGHTAFLRPPAASVPAGDVLVSCDSSGPAASPDSDVTSTVAELKSVRSVFAKPSDRNDTALQSSKRSRGFGETVDSSPVLPSERSAGTESVFGQAPLHVLKRPRDCQETAQTGNSAVSVFSTSKTRATDNPVHGVFGNSEAGKSVSGRSSVQSLFDNKVEPVLTGDGGARSVFGAKMGDAATGPSSSLFAYNTVATQSLKESVSDNKKSLFSVRDSSDMSEVPVQSLFGKTATKTTFGDDFPAFNSDNVSSDKNREPATDENTSKATAKSVFATPEMTPSNREKSDGAVFDCVDEESCPVSTVDVVSDAVVSADRDQSVKRALTRSVPHVVRRRLSSGTSDKSPSVSESVRSLTSLLCKDVPDVCADRRVLLRHFGRFGRVDRLTFNKSRLSAVIHFADHASAEKAKRNGASIHPKLAPMTLYWRQTSGRRDPRQVGSLVPLGARPPPRAGLVPDSEVLDELAAMQGGDAYTHDMDGGKSERVRHLLKPSSRAVPRQSEVRAPSSPRRHSPAPIAGLGALTAAPGPEAGQRAITAMERYRVLDARDKQLRDKLRRKSGGAWSTDLVGTCPDMCPEKERYMREAKHDINAIFERNKNTQAQFEMDHLRAVKKYSRSSADQEAALAHELRTPAALTRTMDYLVRHAIAAGPEGPGLDPGDWFEFVWDRTRAVRKDISQQELSGVGDVALVEKCARFHVYCAAALSHLPADKFDQKINTENLTKCLQTLKYMYHDLSVRNIRCENEPEFRAYDILLNLNQGDTLREIQTWADWVRKSEPVQHALCLYNALSSNNYVRFYRLLSDTSYLQSCLMQRYLSQSRTSALDVITRAHCPSKHTVEYPLQELVRLLAFEDNTECAEFLHLHGLSTAGESCARTMVQLVRSQFREPSSVPPLPAAPSLIAGKLNCSIGEVVNGGPLPADPLTNYAPLNSFDAEGRFLSGSIDIDGATVTTDYQRDNTDNTELVPIIDQLINDVIGRVCTDTLTECRVTRRLAAQIYLQTQSNVLPMLIRSVCEQELQAARELRDQQTKLEKLQKQRYAAVMSAMAGKISAQLIEEVCARDIRVTCSRLLDQLNMAARKAAFHRGCEQIGLSLFDGRISDCCRQICLQLWQEEKERENRLFKTASLFERHSLLRYCWRMWRDSVVRRRRWRLHAPPLSRSHSALTALQLLGGDLTYPRALTSSVTFVERSTDAALCRMLLGNQVLLHPVSIKSLLTDFLNSHSAQSLLDTAPLLLLWKLVLFCPTTHSCECGVSDWLRRKLSDQSETSSSVESNPILQRGKILLKRGTRVQFVVRAVCETSLCSSHWQGASAVLCAVGCKSCAASLVPGSGLGLGSGSISGSVSTLSHLPSDIPVLLVCTESMRADIDRWEWSIVDSAHLINLSTPSEELATPRRLAVIVDLKNAVDVNKSVVQCVHWLFSHRPSLSDTLASSNLLSLLENLVFNEVFCRYRTQRVFRRSRRRVQPPPASLISLYNSVIDHLSRVLSSDDLQALWWPPPELEHCETESLSYGDSGGFVVPIGWNSLGRLAQIRETVLLATLPEWSGGDVNDPVSWSECWHLVTEYGTLVANDDRCCAKIGLVDSLSSILARWKLEVLGTGTEESEGLWHVLIYPAQLPWIDIITCCIRYCISRVTSLASYDVIQPAVYFMPHQLKAFTAPEDWLHISTAGFVDNSMSIDRPFPVVMERNSNSGEKDQLTDSATERTTPKLSDWELKLKGLITEGERFLSEQLHVRNGTRNDNLAMQSTDPNNAEAKSTDVDEQMVSLMGHLSAERRISSLWTGRLEELVSMSDDLL